ncbi:MAG: acyl--CoA ligase [Deltaproteobacteria bacterium]|nr:acyl--CoA ligase [Candidatus Zymogenaceae bacterium]
MNIREYLERAASESGNKTALVFEETRLTYSDLLNRAGALAAFFADRGVSKGTKIVSYLPNIPEFVDVYLAALSLGAVLAPVDFRLRPEEVDEIVKDCRPSFIVSTTAMGGGLKKDNFVKDILFTDGSSVTERADYQEIISETGKTPPPVTIDGEDEALFLYTSGSTGRPKGVILVVRQLDLFPTQMRDTFPEIIGPDIPFGVILPMSHISGPILVNLLLREMSTLVIFPGWRPDVVWKTVQKERVVWFHGVPPIFQMLLADPNLGSYDLSCLKLLAMMGMSVPKTLLETYQEKFPHTTITQGFGLTETSPILTFLSAKDSRRKLGSVGLPVADAEVKIVDEDGKDLPPDTAGDIIARGPMIMKGYYDQPEETARVIRDGWFWTGDLGVFDSEGYLYHIGRSKDIIITGGLNVYPAEVENVLLRHTDVIEAAVVGTADKKRGEVLMAFVVIRNGVPLRDNEILKHCREHLADFKVPKGIVAVDKIPLLSNGKVDKVTLRQMGE